MSIVFIDTNLVHVFSNHKLLLNLQPADTIGNSFLLHSNRMVPAVLSEVIVVTHAMIEGCNSLVF